MQSTTCVRKNVRQVAITFDDGPTPFTLEILDLLDQYQAKASFFLYWHTGGQVSPDSEANY